jgi:DMSO/TMAO reductase YedYZ molybdopterin-dependent catalytic subunit
MIDTPPTSPGWRIGALVGLLLTAPLLAIFWLAAQVVGTPFPPFDLFNLLARVLPGSLVTFGIDLIVTVVVGLNLGELSSSAKNAQQAVAVVITLGLAATFGAGLFAAWNRQVKPAQAAGWLVGGLVGVGLLVVSLLFNTSTTSPVAVNAVWLIAACLVWGAAFALSYARLCTADAPTPTDSLEVIDRRNFLVRLGGATAALTLVGTGLGSISRQGRAEEAIESAARAWSQDNALPNARAAVQVVSGTRPELTPLEQHYRIDINTLPPLLEESSWKLVVNGLVANPVELTLSDLRTNFPVLDQFVTLSCISNYVAGELIGTQRWTGFSLKHLIEQVQPAPEAIAIHITAADGFDEYISVIEALRDERIMLCYAWDGVPLDFKHGFPLRIYLPNRYGMKQPKWITGLEFVPFEEEGYWVRRGWDELALVNATSVIDTVAVEAAFERDGQRYVPLGGIAYAGSQQISAVEVKVDDGPWQPAELREPISDLTWTLWRYDWPFSAGEHTFAVRCLDGRGRPQDETPRDVRPSGATGLHRLRQQV